jgi:hypothetical protein
MLLKTLYFKFLIKINTLKTKEKMKMGLKITYTGERQKCI